MNSSLRPQKPGNRQSCLAVIVPPQSSVQSSGKHRVVRMRLLAFLFSFFVLTAAHAKAQVYASYDGYDEYSGYSYDDPYSPYPPPPYYEDEPQYQEPEFREPHYRLPDRERRQPFLRAARGTITISTRQHVLSYTTSQGQKFVYPIAVGREGKQWFGTTRVVSKRPTPRMASDRQHACEEPQAPGSGEGRATKPAGYTRHLPCRRSTPNSWHQRPLVYRYQCLKWMFPHVPAGCRGALRDGATWDAGHRGEMIRGP